MKLSLHLCLKKATPNGEIKSFHYFLFIKLQKYYYAEAQTTHSTYPDGLEILQFPK